MHEAAETDARASRGSELLEEFLGVVPELAKLHGVRETLAWATIGLLAQYWEGVLDQLDDGDDAFRSDLVRGLRKLYAIHCATNVPVACGVLILALNIEASSLYDDDARLVRALTALHLASGRTRLELAVEDRPEIDAGCVRAGRPSLDPA